MSLNPNLTTDNLVEGLSLTLPDTVASTVTRAPTPGQPVQAPAGEAGLGELAGGAEGLFGEMMKEFTTAFQAFLSAPAFLKGPKTAQAATRPTPGWTGQEAEFLRGQEDDLRQRFSEQAMRQMAETGKIPTLTAGEFLKGISPRTEMEMARPYYRGGSTSGVPSITPRRLRF